MTPGCGRLCSSRARQKWPVPGCIAIGRFTLPYRLTLKNVANSRLDSHSWMARLWHAVRAPEGKHEGRDPGGRESGRHLAHSSRLGSPRYNASSRIARLPGCLVPRPTLDTTPQHTHLLAQSPANPASAERAHRTTVVCRPTTRNAQSADAPFFNHALTPKLPKSLTFTRTEPTKTRGPGQTA